MSEPVRQDALAIIPARGGSKRVPRKNIKAFLGMPMLARTVGLLQASGAFSGIVVSTDDDEIAAIATQAGALVPFRRPPELSNDMAATLPVIAHAIREMEALGVTTASVCCVYPAAVLSRPEDYTRARELLGSSDLDFVFTATSFGFPIQRALRRTPDGRCEMFQLEHRLTRSQDLEPAFHDAGQFYFGTRAAWLEGRPFFGHRSAMLELPRWRVQDIDTLEDWERAEMIFQLLQKEPRIG
ncbi:MAG: pseudaminic acid cytidylyltransferase [Steroidobacteraceae bacterium]